ncbi:MAG: pseudouridylate synthase [Bacteroidetes bacterium]|nr:pseudouridylate synthase [Bacteroidota bacterium]
MKRAGILIPVETLIPQRPPMVMIDTLRYCDAQFTQTTYTVASNGLFFFDRRLSASGILENMAQTTAARMGYLALYGKETKGVVRKGVIGSIRNLTIKALPAAGAALTTSIHLVEEMGDMILVKSKVACPSQIIATCEMIVSLI